MKSRRLPYPWPSMLAATLIIAWQLALAYPAYIQDEALALWLQEDRYLWLALILLGVVFLSDLRRLGRANARYRAQLRQYQDQIDELFDTRRELGTRARTYSDHADKLKMFISERLLEYIEYDEKFLHFKNIASEVRHNGVISYDRTQTALKRAQALCPPEEVGAYQDAADSMLYLWDLLDLSTTDNIALHVANRIYDCEEHYFQLQLNPDDLEKLPMKPTFALSNALRRALLPIVEDPEGFGLLGDWSANASYADDQFRVRIDGDCELLGNENHLVLLIENLLNNALFYARQKAPRQAYNPVSISLEQRDGQAILRVFNRGPHIPEEERERIYQLGFSSRRVNEHHGKGLGLYFVHELTRGFEGRIEFANIDNQDERVTLAVKLANGELLREEIDICLVGGKAMCRLVDSNDAVEKRHQWRYESAIASVEISSESRPDPQLLASLGQDQQYRHIDAGDPQRARWMVEVNNRKRSADLRFVPLDVRGVEFTLTLPTASARLDGEDLDEPA